jgi:hypothetical protein
MEARTLLEDIQSYLELSASVRQDSVKGKVINVGETFVVTFVVKNSSYAALSPHYNFKNIKLFLEETEYAELVDKTTEFTFEMDGLLQGQESVSIDIKYKAFANIGGFRDIFEKELITEAFIEAELDLQSFFTVTKSLMVNTEIKES